MNIAELLELDRAESREAEWNGKTFDIRFYPARLTSPAVVQGIHEGLNGYPLRLADGLAVLLESWDLDWNGEPFPPNPFNLSLCPWEFVVYLADLMTPEVKPEDG